MANKFGFIKSFLGLHTIFPYTKAQAVTTDDGNNVQNVLNKCVKVDAVTPYDGSVPVVADDVKVETITLATNVKLKRIGKLRILELGSGSSTYAVRDALSVTIPPEDRPSKLIVTAFVLYRYCAYFYVNTSGTIEVKYISTYGSTITNLDTSNNWSGYVPNIIWTVE